MTADSSSPDSRACRNQRRSHARAISQSVHGRIPAHVPGSRRLQTLLATRRRLRSPLRWSGLTDTSWIAGGLSPVVGVHGAALWAARRPAGTARNAAGGGRNFLARLPGLRSCAVAAAAHRGARSAGPRRCGTHDAVAGADRRVDRSARARALSGLLCDGIHASQRERPGCRRHRSLAFELALAVSRQPAAGGDRDMAIAQTAPRRAASGPERHA